MFVRRGRFAVALVVAALTLTACGSDSSSPTTEGAGGKQALTVATQPDFFGIPLYFAVQKGFLAKQGIEAKLQEFPTGVEGTEAVVTGQADLTSVAGYPVASLAAKGAKVKIIGHNATSYGWWGIVVDGSIATPQDLYGKTIALQSNSTASYWFDRFVAFHKLDKSKIKVKDAKYAQLVPTFAKGDANAIIHFEPNVTKAISARPGARLGWAGGDDDLLPFIGYVVAGPKISENKEVGVKVLRALRETSAYMKSNQGEVIAFIKSKTGITDDAEAKKILAKIDFSLAFDPASVDQIQQVADYQLEMGNIKNKVDAKSYVITDWVSAI
ncbi:ABC transporter substrate-binding protein [Micromonospora sp. NPDC001898]|uniref:ABC transporter substrate-binding protein n=1 Tax=Micromonospora sp. NPDC001898 TaxID=3364221 RepID=UPI0036CE3177